MLIGVTNKEYIACNSLEVFKQKGQQFKLNSDENGAISIQFSIKRGKLNLDTTEQREAIQKP